MEKLSFKELTERIGDSGLYLLIGIPALIVAWILVVQIIKLAICFRRSHTFHWRFNGPGMNKIFGLGFTDYLRENIRMSPISMLFYPAALASFPEVLVLIIFGVPDLIANLIFKHELYTHFNPYKFTTIWPQLIILVYVFCIFSIFSNRFVSTAATYLTVEAFLHDKFEDFFYDCNLDLIMDILDNHVVMIIFMVVIPAISIIMQIFGRINNSTAHMQFKYEWDKISGLFLVKTKE